MRKITAVSVFVVLTVFLSLNLTAQEEPQSTGPNPMASFMDANWGVNAQDFYQTFESGKLKKSDQFFTLEDFKLGDVTITKIKFKFEPKGNQKITLRGKSLDKMYLTEVLMLMKPEDFETLLQIFKVKYGEPVKYDEYDVLDSAGKKFLQKVARWEDKTVNRMIVMEKQASKLIDGMVMLMPIEKKKPVVKKDTIKAAAEKL